MTPLRSLLFAPGNVPRRLQKALQVGADAVIVDLEDAVPDSEKAEARSRAREYLLPNRGLDRPRRLVRINGMRTALAFGDLEAVAVAGLEAVVLPKAETAGDIQAADLVLGHWERERDLPAGGIGLLPIIETAAGLRRIAEIAAACPRVRHLCFGAADFSADLGGSWSPSNPSLLAARVEVAVAGRAAGLGPPLDTVFPFLEDEAGLVAEAHQAREIGYQGKMTIHPRQVGPVNDVFTPTADEVARARAISQAFAEAERNGSAALLVEGTFVDYPVAARARRLLELDAAIRASGRPGQAPQPRGEPPLHTD